MIESTRRGGRAGVAAADDHARLARLSTIVASSGFVAALLGSALALAQPRIDLETCQALASIAALCAGAFWLARRGRHTAAGRILFLTGALGTTALVLTGRTAGFGDIAIMLYPVLVIAASMLLDRRDSALAMGLVLALLSVVLVATLVDWVPSSEPVGEQLADFGFAVLIVAVSGVASRLLAAGVERSTRSSREHQAALAIVNDELQREAARRESLIRELEARNAELQHFTYTVSHDLKSPLVTIGAFTGCLEKSARSGDLEQLLEDLRWVKQAQERMSELLTDLLELSRAGRLAHPDERLPFSEVVKEARDLTEGVFAQRNARLVVSGQLPEVTGDRRRLVQVLQNLFDNAVKFADDAESPLVEVGVREIDGERVFYVRDQGIGIEPRDHDAVFELFRKLHPDSSGTGVGLALVQRIVEAHGGRVWVESEGLGKGSEFRFTLSEPEAVAAVADGAQESHRAPSG